MSDSRRHPRIPMKARVKISHESFGEVVASTKDISDGGVFLLTDNSDMPAIGTVIQGQVQGLTGDAPILNMEIMRRTEEGIGLRFILD
ncbi:MULTISPECIES: PilZ domain-containing protein [unclassified Oleiphilus]|uniref:PilZ domain-containing protein n=1 Tax=unclassified Oleiphilus TaxID=2631174 RepID=UPI0007C331F7|nr:MULTISPECIES: PilZ domain-containing protein [unclassified Oleiphilus]KZY64840.1 pilus assembly protein PilZ [Oleiphilus sp. HI0066]KZY71523.1 pilus assembly protein PilZ [Oleiphilus sp. HI0067]